MRSKPILGIIIPCFNEQEVIEDTTAKLLKFYKYLQEKAKISTKSFLVFVDDGSKDNTWQMIDRIAKDNDNIRGLKLSGNFGHQNAMLAGIFTYNKEADCLVSIDADLQDNYLVIEEMLTQYSKGSDIVYGVRKSRKTDSFFKRSTAIMFYRIMQALGVTIVFNHADFRLSAQKVNEALASFKEVNLFLRGIFPFMGFNSTEVYYDRKERMAGKTKYPFKKMVSFAFNGISSFSIRPLRWITITGFVIFFACVLASAYAIYGYFAKTVVPGWLSTVLPFYFLGGIQILCIGIIGEYLGKIYNEVKQRPRYIIEKETNN